ncbi:MAG: COX15/CtaA family protein [Burkholderiaceae bacterium]
MLIQSALQLVITALLVAVLPLTVVWVSSDTNKYRKLAWVTLFLTFDLVMFGAFTRLTDSGLGCPDWPGCYGQANPFLAHADISSAQAAMPSGPVTHTKAWIEMIHRYLAMAVGVLIVAMMLIAWRVRKKFSVVNEKLSPWYPTVLFGFVCLQGAFGAWTVTMKLQPIIVTTHLLLGLTLLAMLAWLAARQSEHSQVSSTATVLRVPAMFAVLLLAMQIALGGWVSTNYAALACTDYPLCHGAVLPQMDFANGFTLWRSLGKTASGEFLPFDALTAIHWTHRTFAWLVVAIIAWLAHRAIKINGLQNTGRWLLTIILLQFVTGVSTIFLQWPLALAVIHNGGAALLVILLVMLNYKARIPLASNSGSFASHDRKKPKFNT